MKKAWYLSSKIENLPVTIRTLILAIKNQNRWKSYAKFNDEDSKIWEEDDLIVILTHKTGEGSIVYWKPKSDLFRFSTTQEWSDQGSKRLSRLLDKSKQRRHVITK